MLQVMPKYGMEMNDAAEAQNESLAATAEGGEARASELPDNLQFDSYEDLMAAVANIGQKSDQPNAPEQSAQEEEQAEVDDGNTDESQDSENQQETDSKESEDQQQIPEKTGEEETETESLKDWREIKRTRLSLEQMDDVDRLAIVLKRRNPDMSLAEAIDRAKKQLGITAETGNTESAKPKSATVEPSQVDVLQEKLNALKERHAAALAEYDTANAAEVLKEIEEVTSKLVDARVAAKTTAPQKADADAENAKQVEAASQRKALELYPDVANAQSPLFKRMLEIDNALRESDNPLYFDPGKYLRIAQMAANDLGISPGRKLAQKAAVKTEQVKTKASPPQPYVGVRTASTRAAGVTDIAQRVQSLQSEDDYRETLRAIGLAR
jgi:hypothetical protein